VLILIAERPDELLPTIRSRCQSVRFSPLAISDVAQLLVSQNAAPDLQAAQAAAALAEGSPAVASKLLDSTLRALRETLLEELGKQPFDPSRTAERLVKGIEPFPDLAAQRDAVGWIAHFAATFFRQVARSVVEPGFDDAGASSFAARVLKASGDEAEALERLAGLIERAGGIEDQLSLYASPVLCIESFAYDLANRLRG
jgi:thioredoxin-like negative regulator of GroEL